MDINGRVAMITGGASGLGAATARALAAQGAKVALLDLNMDAGQALAAELGGIAVNCNVASAESGEAALAAVKAQLGAPSILVNCAGIGTAGRVVGKDGPMDLELFSRTIQVNLIGTFNMIRLLGASISALPPAADPNETRGVVINTASVAAFEGQVGQAPYSASKGGVVGLTLPVAREFARIGVRVVTIAPGLFKTPMLLGLPQDVQNSLGRTVPFPARLGDPAEYGALAVHICQNDMVNGEVIRLDGAIRMQPK